MNKIFLITLLLFNSLIVLAQSKIIAHRGFSSVAPQNTLIAFQKAIDCKADYFELDVNKTKDDSLVVIHDSRIDFVSSHGEKGLVAEMTFSDLRKINVGYPSKFGDQFEDEIIPTLREALKLAKGKIKVCIEIKVYGIEKDVLQIIYDLNMHNEVIIFSFLYPVLTKIRSLDKDIQTLFLINKLDEIMLDYAQIIEVNAIGVGTQTIITKEFLALIHERELQLWQWTINDEEEMKKLIHLGMDGIITDYPDKAIKLTKSKNNFTE